MNSESKKRRTEEITRAIKITLLDLFNSKAKEIKIGKRQFVTMINKKISKSYYKITALHQFPKYLKRISDYTFKNYCNEFNNYYLIRKAGTTSKT